MTATGGTGPGTEAGTVGTARASLQRVVQTVTEALDAHATLLLRRTPYGLRVPASHGLPSEAIGALVTTWAGHDPWLAALRAPADSGLAVTGERLVSGRRLRQTPFWQDWLAPLGLGQALIGVIDSRRDSELLLYTLRGEKARSFGRQDVAAMRAIVAGCAAARAGADGEDSDRAAPSVLESLMLPVLLLRADGSLAWANPPGHALFGEHGPLRLHLGRVRARHAGDADAFAQARATGMVTPALLLMGAAPERRQVVRLLPVASGPDGSTQLLVAGPARLAAPSIDLLSQSMGLTRVQAQVVSLLCEGCGTRDIAGRMKMNEHTLRAHLAQLFVRLNVRSRAELIASVLSMMVTLVWFAAPADAGAINRRSIPARTLVEQRRARPTPD